jgi:hypothetical protein
MRSMTVEMATKSTAMSRWTGLDSDPDLAAAPAVPARRQKSGWIRRFSRTQTRLTSTGGADRESPTMSKRSCTGSALNVSAQRARSVTSNSRRASSSSASRLRVVSHSSQSSSTRAGRPSSWAGCNCSSETRNRCIWRVLARKFSEFPQFGHVRDNSSAPFRTGSGTARHESIPILAWSASVLWPHPTEKMAPPAPVPGQGRSG